MAKCLGSGEGDVGVGELHRQVFQWLWLYPAPTLPPLCPHGQERTYLASRPTAALCTHHGDIIHFLLFFQVRGGGLCAGLLLGGAVRGSGLL